MEVDDEYNWLMEEVGFKSVDGPLPVSKREKRTGPLSLYIELQ